MSDVDYYDVQAMIQDARSGIRGEIDCAVREACGQLHAELQELRDEVRALERVLNSRTEHLA